MTLGRSKSPTKAEQAYQDRARSFGCVVCRFRIQQGAQKESDGQCGVTHIHHRNFNDWHGSKRLGQDKVVALGAWHHDGVPIWGWGDDEMREAYGPSFKFASDFREWTNDVLPGQGRGTEAWQAWYDMENESWG